MINVVVDGTTYVPADQPGRPRIGIAVTTRNRNTMLAEALHHHTNHQPSGAVTVVVDDASDKPVDGADYRFDRRVGVATAKNKCLDLLMAAGVDHLFLFDDDVWPVADEWWRPYVESPEPHLAHTWGLTPIWQDQHHTAWHASGGTMLYYTRAVINDVGGMRTDFGMWGCEHVNLSDRIHNRGHTTWRYADVTGSERLFHALDKDPGHRSVATAGDRAHNRDAGRKLWQTMLDDADRVPYRPPTDVILTCLFTGPEAIKSGRGYRPDVHTLDKLAGSIRHGRLIVFHDQLKNPTLTTPAGPAEFVPATCAGNVFFARHVAAWQWLRNHPEADRVWCVDGADVRQLRDPFTELAPGMIHLGWEPATLTSAWLHKHHPERRVQQFLADNPGRQMLNAGLIGGDRATVMELLHHLITYWADVAIDAVQGWQPRTTATVGVGDMPALNMVAYQYFAGRIVTGSRVATVFKQFEDTNEWSWWAHK
jgi:hypothetical protein